MELRIIIVVLFNGMFNFKKGGIAMVVVLKLHTPLVACFSCINVLSG